MGYTINGIINEKLREFKIVYWEFMNIFKEEEVKIILTNPPIITLIIYDGWKSSIV
jgi:hypothetical protein